MGILFLLSSFFVAFLLVLLRGNVEGTWAASEGPSSSAGVIGVSEAAAAEEESLRCCGGCVAAGDRSWLGVMSEVLLARRLKDLDAVADEGVGEEGLFLSSFEASADSEEGKLVGLDFAPDGDLGIRENYRFPLC